MLPAWPGGFDYEILHVHFRANRSRRNGKMSQCHSRQRAPYQLRHKARRAHLHQSRHHGKKSGLAQARTYAEHPAGASQAALVKNIRFLNVWLDGMEVQRHRVRRDNNFKMPSDMRIQSTERRPGIAMIV